MTKLLPVVFLIFVLFACGKKPHYDKTFSFEDKIWDQRVMPTFKVDIQDTSQVYDIILTLRTTTSYSFNNLWVFMDTKSPSGLKGRMPYQIKISNEDGSWVGTKSGTVVENQLTFKSRKFPEKGEFVFAIEQGITTETIDEVLDIGLRLTKSK